MTEITKMTPSELAPPAPPSEGAALLSMLERMSTNPAVDVDKFERLLAMRERLHLNDVLRKFNAAVAAAKASIGPIFKNRAVAFTSSKGDTSYRHEDFAEIARTVDPVLSQHGLGYRFRSQQAAGKLTVTCILFHAAGHAEETTLSAAEDHTGNKNSIQAIGSAATYLQRYTLKLALGLASSADDDGRGAGAAAVETITEAQGDEIKAMLEARDISLSRFCERYKLNKLTDLPLAKLVSAKKAIEGVSR